jgi:hypothetical protein
MKKFFSRIFFPALCAGVILCAAGLTGCQNPFDEPEEAAAPREKGLVEVTIGDAAGARTIAPTGVPPGTTYKLSFTPQSGQPGVDPIEVDPNVPQETVTLDAGSWIITATASTGAGASEVIKAEGSVSVTVRRGTSQTVKILLGPKTGGDPGTFQYSLMIPSELTRAELIITTAEGDPIDTILLSYRYQGINDNINLPPGQYLVRVRLEKATKEGVMYAGLTEALHIYSELTSTLEQRTFNAEDFKVAVSDLDLTKKVPAPASWEAPLGGFDGPQYTGEITWEAIEPPVPSKLFRGGTVYKAVVELKVKPDYTFTGVAENSFTHAGAEFSFNYPNDNIVTIIFPPTEALSITGVTVLSPSPTVAQGWTQKFTAEVTGSSPATPPQDVSWTVSGNTDPGTSITQDGGILTVALNEASGTLLTVTATSAADKTKGGVQMVIVTPGK